MRCGIDTTGRYIRMGFNEEYVKGGIGTGKGSQHWLSRRRRHEKDKRHWIHRRHRFSLG